MGGGKQIVGLMTVLQTEDVVAVFLPAMGRLIRLARQQSREMHLLGADAVDLLTDDGLDLVEDPQTQRQPGPDAGSGLADVTGALQELGGIDVRVGRVFAQCAQEQSRHTKGIGSHKFKATQSMGRTGNL